MAFKTKRIIATGKTTQREIMNNRKKIVEVNANTIKKTVKSVNTPFIVAKSRLVEANENSGRWNSTRFARDKMKIN
jgi:phosphotransferase system IIA component